MNSNESADNGLYISPEGSELPDIGYLNLDDETQRGQPQWPYMLSENQNSSDCSELWQCEICDSWMYFEERNFDEHQKGKRHKTALHKRKLEQVARVNLTHHKKIPNRDNDGRICQVSDEYKEKPQHDIIDKSELCDALRSEIDVSLPVTELNHEEVNTMIHDKRKLSHDGNVEISYYLTSDLTYCNLCCTHIGSDNEHGRVCHLQGKKHRHALKRLNENTNSTTHEKCSAIEVVSKEQGWKHNELPTSTMISDMAKFSNDADVDNLRPSKPVVHMSYYITSDLKYCTLCCVTIGNNTGPGRIEHLAGKNHRNALKRLSEKGNSTTDEIKQSHSVIEVVSKEQSQTAPETCPLCLVEIGRCEPTWRSHLAGKKHRKSMISVQNENQNYKTKIEKRYKKATNLLNSLARENREKQRQQLQNVIYPPRDPSRTIPAFGSHQIYPNRPSFIGQYPPPLYQLNHLQPHPNCRPNIFPQIGLYPHQLLLNHHPFIGQCPQPFYQQSRLQPHPIPPPNLSVPFTQPHSMFSNDLHQFHPLPQQVGLPPQLIVQQQEYMLHTRDSETERSENKSQLSDGIVIPKTGTSQTSKKRRNRRRRQRNKHVQLSPSHCSTNAEAEDELKSYESEPLFDSSDDEVDVESLSLSQIITRKLMRGKYECMICISRIARDSSTWSCSNCSALFHTECILGWIKSSRGFSWRCPGCQHPHMDRVVR
eukprot:169086_1